MWRSFIAVSVGGMLGCLLRWVLAMLLNRYFPAIPPGTLGGEPHRLLHHRDGHGLLHRIPGVRAGMAAVPNHRILRRPDHLLDFLRRNRDAAAIRTSPMGLGRIGAAFVGSLLMTFAGIATAVGSKPNRRGANLSTAEQALRATPGRERSARDFFLLPSITSRWVRPASSNTCSKSPARAD